MTRPVSTRPHALNRLIELLGDKWSIPLMDTLADRPHRFNELMRRLDLNPKVLAHHLRVLEQHDLVARVAWPTVTLRAEYELTDFGREFRRRLDQLDAWIARRPESPLTPQVSSLGSLSGPGVAVPRVAKRPSSGHTYPRSWSALGRSALMHLSVSVRDIHRSALAFAEIFGMHAPETPQAAAVSLGTSHGEILVCTFRFPNFAVEFVQHVNGWTPFDDFTRKYGDAVHHIGFDVAPHDFTERVLWLERKGGTCVLGGAATHYADLDFHEHLGTTVEVLFAPGGERAGHEAWCDGGGTAGEVATLAGRRITHVGIVVEDIERTARAYAELFDVELPRVRYGTPHFPAGASVAAGAAAKLATLRQPNVAIQLIEPVGASPLRDHLEQHGPSVHHIGFSLQDNLDRAVSFLEAMGGRRVLGRDGDHYAQVDLGSRLGLVVELNAK